MEKGYCKCLLTCTRWDYFRIQDLQYDGVCVVESPSDIKRFRKNALDAVSGPKNRNLKKMLFWEGLRQYVIFVEDTIAGRIAEHKLPKLLYLKLIFFDESESISNFYNLQFIRKINFFLEINLLFYFFIFFIFVHIFLLF